MSEKYKSSDIVPMIDTACRIMSYIYEAGGESGISAIASDLSITKSNVFRALKTLSKWNFIQKNDLNDKYQLGTFFVMAGEQKKINLDVVAISRPLMNDISKELGESVNLGTLYDNKVLALESISNETSGLIYRLNPIFDLYCSGMGKLFMSTFSKEDVYKYFSNTTLEKKTINTIVSPDQMWEELQKIKTNGYSSDNEEYEYGLFCIAAPIYSINNVMVAAISISGPKSRMQSKGMELFYEKITTLASTISTKLGCTLYKD